MPPTPALTAVDNRNINAALNRIADTMADLEKAKEAGLDVDDSMATLDAFKYQLETVKKNFLPNMP